MLYQELFRTAYVDELIGKLRDERDVSDYFKKRFEYDESKVLFNYGIERPASLHLHLKTGSSHFDLENSIMLHEAYKNMSPSDAADMRIWTHMAHVTHWDYLQKRFPIPTEKDIDAQIEHILTHWFLTSVSSRKLIDHGIARLWWMAHLTYDETRKNPYELTKILISRLDFTRILVGTLGRNRLFTQAVLEFAVENPECNSEIAMRDLMVQMNFVAGHDILPSLTKEELKGLFSKHKQKLKALTSAGRS